MSVQGLDHIGIAVSDIDGIISLYRDVLNMAVLDEESVPTQGVRVVKLDAGNTHVELIEPLADDTPVGKYIAKRGEGIHHICFSVKDLRASLRLMAEKGYRPLTPEPQKGASGREVVFLHPKDARGVLIELSAPALS